MRYKVNLKETEEGYAVWCPGLPGCWSQGQTEDEAQENIKDAIQSYLQTLEEGIRSSFTLVREDPLSKFKTENE
ncbi:MAG TPA: type II toxin-antitoxin system HicB family antitoxin [Thermodesulfobacteriota bacterium]|nr:type II toxin-antitoxin system HicB family antitoxin [Thermodesulfobacteriota bacterium]